MKTLPEIFRGTERRLIANIVDEAGDPVDPATVKLFVKPPKGDIVEYAPNNDELGRFSQVVNFNQVGDWVARFEAANPNIARETKQPVTGDKRFD